MRIVNRIFFVVFLLGATGLAQQATNTTVPNLISYSGILHGPNGAVIAATATGITFAIYKQQESGAPVWIETQNVTADAGGHYTVLLGSTTPDGIPVELFSEKEERWLGVQVQGEAEQPRVLLVSVPYAMEAAEADRLSGHSATDFVTTESLQSAVQQQLQQQQLQVTVPLATSKTTAGIALPPAITQGPTDFLGGTDDQVVKVTQNGSGLAVRAISTTGSTAIQANSSGTAITAASNGTTSSSIGFLGTSTRIGIKGASIDTTGSSAGIQGTSSAPTGFGIEGTETSRTGVNYGVFGTAQSNQGIGLRGTSSSPTGLTFGLFGTSASSAGVGIFANNTSSTGTTYALQTSIRSPNGVAALFQNIVPGGIMIRAITGLLGSETEEFRVDGSGNVVALGGVTAASFTGNGSALTGVLPGPGSPFYIQNGTATQASANFNIDGNGTLGGLLSANTVNTMSSYQIGGSIALYSNLPTLNTFVGLGAGAVTTGQGNTFVGTSAGGFNTTGFGNTFFGAATGGSNSTGSENSFFGVTVGALNISGSDNAFFGKSAGAGNLNGSENAFFGHSAGTNNNQGSFNSFFGYHAGFNNTTGSSDLYLANDGPTSTESNTIRIGTDGAGNGQQNAVYIAGILSNSISGGTAVVVDSNGRLGVGGTDAMSQPALVKAQQAQIAAQQAKIQDLQQRLERLEALVASK